VEDENPVICIEHKLLYPTKGPVQDGYYTIPLGQADIKREGKDVTIISYSKMVLDSLEAADELSGRGIDAEVIDLRTLKPLDKETIIKSVKKTKNLIVVHEACKTMGFGAEIITIIAESGLEAKVKRVAGEDSPVPYSKPLERRVIPNKDVIINAVLEI
jgi:pyruvate dehydrogenase E1 component beta subunit